MAASIDPAASAHVTIATSIDSRAGLLPPAVCARNNAADAALPSNDAGTISGIRSVTLPEQVQAVHDAFDGGDAIQQIQRDVSTAAGSIRRHVTSLAKGGDECPTT